MAVAPERSIFPLPEEVVAQIKSSTAVVSLTGVVLELLKNSLDAGATRVECTIDFGRGGCLVEDDGLGIPPLEFRDGGYLGKQYCTSKYFSHAECLGRNGVFLASLAAMSLLTITSHHHEHRSHNSMTFHHSKAIEREIPAPPRFALKYEMHGTRVTVRDLFGNFPVRVKQRAVVVEQKAEHDRLWQALRRDVTSLLLSWGKTLSLKIRNEDHQTMLSFNGRSLATPNISSGPKNGIRRPQELQFMLDALTQTSFIRVKDWSSWVPAAASTSRISIRGAISLEPAPTKRIQFISLGIRPLPTDTGHNELYDEVNRVFSLSSFGTIDDDLDANESEILRRENDRRFKSEGFTNRQLKGRKGVDRYPMFHLRISLKNTDSYQTCDDRFLDNETNLQAVVEVLNAMTTQWLSVHHFRPRKHRVPRDRPDTSSTSTSGDDGVKPNSVSFWSKLAYGNPKATTLRPASAKSESRKRKRSTLSVSTAGKEMPHQPPFSDWSRVKSGRSQFYDTLCSAGKHSGEKSTACPPPFNTSNMEPIFPGSLDNHFEYSRQESLVSRQSPPPEEHGCEEFFTWTNPMNKQTLLLNGRTGCVVPRDVPTHPNDSNFIIRPNALNNCNKSVHPAQTSQTAGEMDTPWLDGLLHDWNNPIFKPTERAIQKLSLAEHDPEERCHNRLNYSHSSHVDAKKAFDGPAGVSKLTKEGLSHAQVIAQLDKKFILLKMANGTYPTVGRGRGADALVLVDQHAADERVRVESLLKELCTPLPDTHNLAEYRSKLGHKSQVAFVILDKPLQFSISPTERVLFDTHAARFADWGILFDLSMSRLSTAQSSVAHKEHPILSVTTLPPSVSERCKGDPKILISFLRAAVWRYAEDMQLGRPLSQCLEHLTEVSNWDADEGGSAWFRRIATCPPSLVDLINSRACRSAIMFNDELSIGQCERLVKELSTCLFPFMCAHGRPSMVPLVDLGERGSFSELGPGSGERLGLVDEEKGRADGFIKAWKGWKRE